MTPRACLALLRRNFSIWHETTAFPLYGTTWDNVADWADDLSTLRQLGR